MAEWYRVTVRSEQTELRGYCSARDLLVLSERLGGPEHDTKFMVVASEAPDPKPVSLE